ncbi:Hypothetical predicted protein [Paramuricea clavata]|uniref:Uncharacterized protein n=1 Tax=Paramuricea clavata TaxID=317549 RepID=A0A7D9HJZ5_PARCT|nr:Hypothetical predicted protein [Paramuricea clavata]
MAANRRQYKHRRKWTDQVNEDLLSCKREAVAMTQMEQPPLDGNSKKKGYIKLMKELWDAKGYNDFGFSSPRICVIKLQGWRNLWSWGTRETYQEFCCYKPKQFTGVE